jgi:hypothetical protein
MMGIRSVPYETVFVEAPAPHGEVFASEDPNPAAPPDAFPPPDGLPVWLDTEVAVPDDPDAAPLLLAGALPDPVEPGPVPALVPLPAPNALFVLAPVPLASPLPLTGVEVTPPHAAMNAPTMIPKPAPRFVMTCVLC